MTAWISFRKEIFSQNRWLLDISPEDRLWRGQAYFVAKRAIDLVVVFLVLLLLAPVFILCAFLIKLEDPNGPIFFIQWRTGKGGQRFAMYKFRTMVYDAEELKYQLKHLNELQWPDFKISNDPRVTRMGRILRKTSLDELPQIINVLKGEMTLVGPRPTSFSSDTYALWQTERLDVVPGITGLWQILGRGSMEFTHRVYLDVFYIEHRCLWLDIQILVRTILVVIMQRGVH